MNPHLSQKKIISRMMELYKCRRDADLARHLGVQKGAISNYRNDRRMISIALLMKVAEETGVSIDWLISGESRLPVPRILIRDSEDYRNFRNETEGDKFFPVKLLKDGIAAGSPSDIRESDIDGYCMMKADRTWMPGDPDRITCCRILGDSMHPIVKDGDIVAIDHSQKDPGKLHGKMAAFKTGEGAAVKWLSYPRKDLVLGIPENKSELAHTIFLNGNEIAEGIIGKVVWWIGRP